MIRDQRRVEFGDFQTPLALAKQVVELLKAKGITPRSVVEPTCGLGTFVEAALSGFNEGVVVAAFDVNPEYVQSTAALNRVTSSNDNHLQCEIANFFTRDWAATLASLPEPTVILGNPPWVTASGLGALGSDNLPAKSNFQNRKGLDALTGKSNFDVAEWMLLKMIEAGRGRDVTVAMLVKTGVARRVLAHVWRTGANMEDAHIYRFDAAAHFGVSADACLFLFRAGGRRASLDCVVAELDQPDVRVGQVGWRDGALVSDPLAYDRDKSLILSVPTTSFRWRSGVKHDCSGVMELKRDSDSTFVNSKGERVDLEPEYVYPLLKGTDLIHGRVLEARKWLLVTQTKPGEDTTEISRRAPRTWAYLCGHSDELDSRKSSIYRGKPRFSVFGVGPYTFTPWKVAISALHKRFVFSMVGPIEGRLVVFDDTCYHLACSSMEEAQLVSTLLNSETGQSLLGSLVFWDAKRPITAEILQKIDLSGLAARLGLLGDFDRIYPTGPPDSPQATLEFDPIPVGSSIR